MTDDTIFIETQEKTTAHEAKTFLITCMDFRIQDDICNFMDRLGYNTNYDHFIVAGSSLGFIQKEYPHWGKTAFDHMEIGLSLHHFREVIIIDHEDCGTYKKLYPYNSKEEEYKNHEDCMQKVYNLLSKKYPKLKFRSYIIDIIGNIKEIKIVEDPFDYTNHRHIHNDHLFLKDIHSKVRHVHKAHANI